MNIVSFNIIGFHKMRHRPHLLMLALQSLGNKIKFVPCCATSLHGMEEFINSAVTIPQCQYSDFLHDRINYDHNKWREIIEFLKDDGVIIVNVPYWYPIVKKIQRESGALLVYDILDYYPGFSDLAEKEKELLKYHQRLCGKADLIITSSQSLKDTGFAPERTHVINNACVFSRFNVERKSGGVIGYSGVIADWFDMEELLRLADYYWIELVGPVAKDVYIPKHHRIKYHDFVDWKTLPNILKKWDCGLVLHKDVPVTQHADCAKIYEYLAVGLPVVAPPTPANIYFQRRIENEGPEFQDLVALNSEWFYHSVQVLLRENTLEKELLRKRFASQNTWEHRAFEFLELVETVKGGRH